MNAEKIKLLHELGIWDEYVRCSIADGNKQLEKDIYERTKEKVKRLNDAYERSNK